MVTLGAAGSRALGRNRTLLLPWGQRPLGKEVPLQANGMSPPLVRPKSDESSVLLLHRALGEEDTSRCVWYQGLALPA